jgi:hypothetical protein
LESSGGKIDWENDSEDMLPDFETCICGLHWIVLMPQLAFRRI